MTNDDQVKEIIKMLSPESSEKQVDAVFLVKQFIEKSTHQIKKAHRQIEEQSQMIQHVEGNLHTIINDKLKLIEELRDIKPKYEKALKQIQELTNPTEEHESENK